MLTGLQRALLAVGFAALAGLGLGPLGIAAARTNRARVARSMAAIDSGHLHLAHKGGEEITEEGHATGTIPGKVIAHLVIGPTVVAKFTIHTSVGTVSGEGSGRPKGHPEEPSFAGRMTISHGTGRYKHAHGSGGFYGTLNRSSYAMVVQTTGTLSY